jgi:hypothetical protein
MASRTGIGVVFVTLPLTVAAAVVGVSSALPRSIRLGALEVRGAAAQEAPAAASPPLEQHSPANKHPREAVIRPGQEELVAEMLGRGAKLPGGCTWAGAEADHALIRATYSCPAGEVVFTLQHPSTGRGAPIQTERFAITVLSGNPPSGLADALATLIRSREGAFEWTWIGESSGGPFSSATVLLIAALVGLVAVGWMLRQRRRP